MAQTRVFISAASREFRPLRERLAALLQRSGTNVEYQEIFPQTASDTVRKLGDLIKDCPLLVHLVGHYSGSVADTAAVSDLLDGIPADQFLHRLPDLRQQLGDFSGITYTQWEAFLALHHRVPVFVYAPSDACESGTQTVAETFTQREHLEHLVIARRYPQYCRDDADFVGNILADVYRHFGLTPPVDDKPQNLPYPSLGTLFKGRANFLATLGVQIAQAKATVTHGMGGVGKTRAAVEYAWEHAPEYRALLFVTADSPEALERNLAALCGPLVLNLPEQDAPKTPVQVAAVLRWLNQHPGWFLIVDNVDTMEAQDAVMDLLAKIPEGHVVITSRLADWPAGVTALDLDKLSENSSIDFLLERTEDRRIRRDTDRQTAAQIARLLDCLALALEQCAAYIRHRRCALTDYLADWEDKRTTVLNYQDVRKSHYTRSLAITYETSIAQLSENARELFRILSWVAPDPIPIWAVECITAFPDPRALLVELADLHLARLSADGTTCTVHRVLQEIARQQQTDAQPRALSAALEWMNLQYQWGASDVHTWATSILLAPHATATAIFAIEHAIPEPSARLLSDVGSFHYTQANFRTAEPLMWRALAIAEGTYGDSHPAVAIRLNNLALLLNDTNRAGEAEPLIRRALEIDEASYGDWHPRVAVDLNSLAQLLQTTNRAGEAEPLFRRALAIQEASYGDSHPDVAMGLNNLAQLLQTTNRLAEAEPLMRRALAIAEATYGDSHPDVATQLNNLAHLLKATNRLAEAEPLMRRALIVSEASYGDCHPAVAIRLNNLAHLLHDTNRSGEAEPLIRRALAIDEAAYGDEHPEVATDLNNLAQLLQATNRLAEAEPLMRRALAITEASYGDSHPAVATVLSSLAGVLQATNRLAEAEPLMRRALAIDEASYGDSHPDVAMGLNNLALLLNDTNRAGEAEPLVRRALEIDEASYGDWHPRVAVDLNSLAQLLQTTNRAGEAEPLFRRALAIQEASYGASHPNVAVGLNNLALLLQQTNRLDEAERLFRRALAIQEASYGDSHPRVAVGLNNLALLLHATNRSDEAEPLFRRQLVIFLKFKRDTGHKDPGLITAITTYTGVLLAMGETEARAIESIRELMAQYAVSI